MSFGETISIQRPYDKKGAPSCGLYLLAPDNIKFRLFAEQARAAFTSINNSKYERNMHALEISIPAQLSEEDKQSAIALVRLCKDNGIVPIIKNNVDFCIEARAEGVIVSSVEAVKAARETLGDSMIIGMSCHASRDAIQAALNAGVDYVTIACFFAMDGDNSADISMLEWYSSVTHLPAAIIGELNEQRGIAWVKAGAGFLAAGSWVWDHKEGPKSAIFRLMEVIEHGLSQQNTTIH